MKINNNIRVDDQMNCNKLDYSEINLNVTKKELTTVLKINLDKNE